MQSATLTPELLDRLTRDPLQLASTLPATHPADLARVLETMQPAVAAHIVAALPAEAAGSVLAQSPFRRPERVVEHLGDRFLTPVLHAMPPAALAALLRRTHGSERDRLLGLVDDSRRQAVTPLLEYRSDVVAAAMTTGSVELPDSWTAAEACAHIAALDHGDSATAGAYVLDATGRVSHALPMATLLRASRDQRLRDLSPRMPRVVVAPTHSVHEAADVMSHYGLAAIPVVADDGHLLGELRADRALDVLTREQARATRTLAAGSLLGVLTTLAAMTVLLPLMTWAVHITTSGLPRVALAVSVALWAVAVIGVLTGAMLPFLIRALLGRERRAPATFASVLVDTLGVLVYYAVAFALLHAAAR